VRRVNLSIGVFLSGGPPRAVPVGGCEVRG